MRIVVLTAVAMFIGCAPTGGPVSEGAVLMNELSGETSPYLLQHADNPVHWQPWGEEAFEAARRLDRPVFLSIGYSSCHWCHVMEEESFEDEEVAALLNETFVCVKVDREERPDIDAVYMRYAMAMNGGGGWPLTLILTPDGSPFFAATYLPRTAWGGRPGLLELIPLVAGEWSTGRERLQGFADRMVASGLFDERAPTGGSLGQEDREACFRSLSISFDSTNGGFGSAPKFPSPHNLIFLLRYWSDTGEDSALRMVAETLTAIRGGGVYDQIGFGLHRYSTDGRWLVPHFEKMLYDQAMFSLAALEAFQATGDGSFADMALETIEYVLRELRSPEGVFYSSEDADSPGGEGAFYTWTTEELVEVLGEEDGAIAAEVWGVSEEGNFSEHGVPTGRSVLSLSPRVTEVRSADLERIRTALFEARSSRPGPSLDWKVQTNWNGLMIVALARAGRVLDRPDLTAAAQGALDSLMETMVLDEGRIAHSSSHDVKGSAGFLDDYAFIVWACLELYSSTFDPADLELAVSLQGELDGHFLSPAGGYYNAADYSDGTLPRFVDGYDGAMPSGNSVTLGNLVTLWQITGSSRYIESARGIGEAFATAAEGSPSSFVMMLSATPEERAVEVRVEGPAEDPDVAGMLSLLASGYMPRLTIVRSDSTVTEPPGAFVCSGGRCLAPARSTGELAQRLEAVGQAGFNTDPVI